MRAPFFCLRRDPDYHFRSRRQRGPTSIPLAVRVAPVPAMKGGPISTATGALGDRDTVPTRWVARDLPSSRAVGTIVEMGPVGVPTVTVMEMTSGRAHKHLRTAVTMIGTVVAGTDQGLPNPLGGFQRPIRGPTVPGRRQRRDELVRVLRQDLRPQRKRMMTIGTTFERNSRCSGQCKTRHVRNAYAKNRAKMI